MSFSEKHCQSALPLVDPRLRSQCQRRRDTQVPRPCALVFINDTIRITLRFIITFILLYNVYSILPMINRYYGPSDVTSLSPVIDVPEHIQRLWGQYSPYFPAGKYVPPPKGCNITQVNILQRHGARYPAHSDAPTYIDAVRTLSSAHEFADALSFMKKYEYTLDEDDLIALGARQSWEAGREAWVRYGEGGFNVVDGVEDVFVRASGMGRVVDSAGNWTRGFKDTSEGQVAPKISEILSEEVNNTLNNDCPNASDGSAEMDTWLHVFAPPIAKRLNAAAPGANLSAGDVFGLMAMCPFESIAKVTWAPERQLFHSTAKKAKSPFCDLFSEEEWAAFEYHGDVEKYYKTGPGNALGPVQGVGYTNELLARLTNAPVVDHTTHNASLAFPLRRALYADFSHENAMVGVFAAIGLFDAGAGGAPDPKRMPEDERVWRASRMVPFSARMVTERLECAMDREAGNEKADGTYVRVFVNDSLQPMEFCGALEDGMCRLEGFVQSQGYSRRSGDGDFEKCYK